MNTDRELMQSKVHVDKYASKILAPSTVDSVRCLHAWHIAGMGSKANRTHDLHHIKLMSKIMEKLIILGVQCKVIIMKNNKEDVRECQRGLERYTVEHGKSKLKLSPGH